MSNVECWQYGAYETTQHWTQMEESPLASLDPGELALLGFTELCFQHGKMQLWECIQENALYARFLLGLTIGKQQYAILVTTLPHLLILMSVLGLPWYTEG